MQAIPIQHITKGYVMRSGYKTNEWYRAPGRYGWVRLHEITIKSGNSGLSFQKRRKARQRIFFAEKIKLKAPRIRYRAIKR